MKVVSRRLAPLVLVSLALLATVHVGHALAPATAARTLRPATVGQRCNQNPPRRPSPRRSRAKALRPSPSAPSLSGPRNRRHPPRPLTRRSLEKLSEEIHSLPWHVLAPPLGPPLHSRTPPKHHHRHHLRPRRLPYLPSPHPPRNRHRPRTSPNPTPGHPPPSRCCHRLHHRCLRPPPHQYRRRSH